MTAQADATYAQFLRAKETAKREKDDDAEALRNVARLSMAPNLDSDLLSEFPGEVLSSYDRSPALQDAIRDVVRFTADDPHLTAEGRRDERSKRLGQTVRDLGIEDARLGEAATALTEQLAKAERDARAEWEPQTEFDKMRALEMARAIREAGKNPAERTAFVNRGSVDLKRAAVFMGPEVTGLDSEFIDNLRARTTPDSIREAREQAAVDLARIDNERSRLRSLRAIAVGVCDVKRLIREKHMQAGIEHMTREERVEHLRSNKLNGGPRIINRTVNR